MSPRFGGNQDNEEQQRDSFLNDSENKRLIDARIKTPNFLDQYRHIFGEEVVKKPPT